MLSLKVQPKGKVTVGNIVIQNKGRRPMKVGIAAPSEVRILRDGAKRKDGGSDE